MKFGISLLVILLIVPVHAAPALLQHDEWMNQVSQTSDSQTMTFSEGSLVVVVVGLSNAGTDVTVSSPGLDFHEDVAHSPYDIRLEMWSAANVPAGSHTITVRCAQPEYIRWGIAEFSGVGSVIETASNHGLTTSISTGTVTTNADNTLLVAAVRTDGDETAHGSISAGSGYTFVWPWGAIEPNQKLMAEYRVVNAGTYSGGFSMQSGDNGGWTAGLVAFAPSTSSGANIHYVRDGSSGDGSSWSSAWDSLPSTLQRGHTYYIADGTYTSYKFDDPASGQLWIDIKKATAGDHGTDSEWQDSYGDGEALFTSSGSIWSFAPGSKYYHIDGQTGEGKNGYGFRLYSTASRDSSVALVATDTSGKFDLTGDHRYITIEHVDFDWDNGEPSGPCNGAVAVAWRPAKPSHDIIFRNNYIHNASGGAMYFQGGSNFVIDNNYVYQMGDETFGGTCPGLSSHKHWETFWFTYIDNITFSNNVLENAYPNGQTGWVMFGDTMDVKVYNNVFFCSEEGMCAVGGNGIIASWTANTNHNIYIYHNTFVDLWDGGHFLFQQGSGFYGRNNLYYNPSFSCGLADQSHAACGGGQACCGTQQQTGITSTIFAGYALDDFWLSGHTEPGMVLDAPYNIDKNGNERVNWDRGAYEYTGACTPMGISELSAVIGQWKDGDKSIQQVMQSIKLWKAGC